MLLFVLGVLCWPPMVLMSLSMPCDCPTWQFCSGDRGRCSLCKKCRPGQREPKYNNCAAPVLCTTGPSGPECPELVAAVGVDNFTVGYSMHTRALVMHTRALGIRATTTCVQGGQNIESQLNCTGFFNSSVFVGPFWQGNMTCAQPADHVSEKSEISTTTRPLSPGNNTSSSSAENLMIHPGALLVAALVILLVLSSIIVAGAVLIYMFRRYRRRRREPRIKENLVPAVQPSPDPDIYIRDDNYAHRQPVQHSDDFSSNSTEHVPVSVSIPANLINGSTTPVSTSDHHHSHELSSLLRNGSERCTIDDVEPPSSPVALGVIAPNHIEEEVVNQGKDEDSTHIKEPYNQLRQQQRAQSSIDLHRSNSLSLRLNSEESHRVSHQPTEHVPLNHGPNIEHAQHLMAVPPQSDASHNRSTVGAYSLRSQTGIKHAPMNRTPTENACDMTSNDTTYSDIPSRNRTTGSSWTESRASSSSSSHHYSSSSSCNTSPSDDIGTMSDGNDNDTESMSLTQPRSSSQGVTRLRAVLADSGDSGISQPRAYSGLEPVEHSCLMDDSLSEH